MVRSRNVYSHSHQRVQSSPQTWEIKNGQFTTEFFLEQAEIQTQTCRRSNPIFEISENHLSYRSCRVRMAQNQKLLKILEQLSSGFAEYFENNKFKRIFFLISCFKIFRKFPLIFSNLLEPGEIILIKRASSKLRSFS